MSKMKNKNSTRRSFGRRALAFGIAMFAMVTLTAVGFAAWLISSNATAEANGGIVTETVTQANIKLVISNVDSAGKLVEYTSATSLSPDKKYEIVYAPKSTETSGLVVYDGSNGDKPENLKFSFIGSVENWDRVGHLKFSVKVPEQIIRAAGITGTSGSYAYNKASAYISLPEYATDMDGKPLPKIVDGEWNNTAMTAPVDFDLVNEAATLSKTAGDSSTITITAPGSGSTATFEGQNLTFGWGARYAQTNPATLINTAANGATIGLTGINKATDTRTTNKIQLELMKLQSVVNNIALDTALFEEAGVDLEGKTLEDYVEQVEPTEVLKTLTKIQEKLVTKINGNRPVYTLYIEAIVR